MPSCFYVALYIPDPVCLPFGQPVLDVVKMIVEVAIALDLLLSQVQIDVVCLLLCSLFFLGREVA